MYPRIQQDGKTLDNEIEVVEGMRFDRGYISPYFVTDNKTQMCEMENPLILIVERKVSRARAVSAPTAVAVLGTLASIAPTGLPMRRRQHQCD